MNKINFLVLVLSLSFSQTYSCPTESGSSSTEPSGSCDYSSICQYHSACFENLGSTCDEPKTVTISTDDQNLILQTHNDIRERVASGLENTAAGGSTSLPGAKMMYKLTWDSELADIAQKWVNQCVMKHDCRSCRLPLDGRFKVGQNLAGAGSSPNPATFDYETMTKKWYYKEISDIKLSYVDNYVFGNWGHASQVIWGETYAVGCGAIVYKYSGYWYNVFICNYGPAGNLQGAPMYEKANSASEIASSCVTEDGQIGHLCVKSPAKTNLYETAFKNNNLLKAACELVQ